MKYSTIMFNKMSSSSFLRLYTLSYMIKKDQEVFGKEILDDIRSFNSLWKPSHGTLYPILGDMCNEGLIKLAYEYEGRRFYSITDDGIEYYKENAEKFKEMLMQSAKFYESIAANLPE